jgi:DinB family protein
MPAFLQRAARTLEGQATRGPSGGGFSIVEHAWHLADLEHEGFGARLRRLLTEDDPALPDFDGARLARERNYVGRPLDGGLAAFVAARAANLAVLRSVPAESWAWAGRQEGVGVVTLNDVPRLMREHDDSHREEIDALIAGLAPAR